MKRLIAHRFGKKLYTSFSAGQDNIQYTIYYKSNEEKFYLVANTANNTDDVTQIYEADASSYIDLLAGFDDLINTIRALSRQGFSQNNEEYNKAVDWLIEEDAKLNEKHNGQSEEPIDNTNTDNAVDEMAATDENTNENTTDTNNNNKEIPKSKKNQEYKIIEFFISNKEENWMEDEIAQQVVNHIITYYSFTPLSKRDFWTYSGVQPTPEELAGEQEELNNSTARRTRLRKVLAYQMQSVINNATQTGVINDLTDYLDNMVSLYMTNENDTESGDSCAGFILNYNGKFIAFGNKFDEELQSMITQHNIYYRFQSFIEELDDFIQRYNLTSVKDFSDFGAAENFVLSQNSNIQRRISVDESIAGPSELYGQAKEKAEQEKEKAEQEKQKAKEEHKNTKYWKVRIHYKYKDPEVVEGLKAWIRSIEPKIRPYNPKMKLD